MTIFRRKITCLCALLALTTQMLGACGSTENTEKENNENAEQDQKNTDPALGLSIPMEKQTSNILVDQNGYLLGAEKMVIFQGKDIDNQFQIRSVEDDRVLFTGNINSSKTDSSGEVTVSYGYFTDFQSEGNFYIYNETLGSSYSFAISSDAYENIFEASGKKYYLNRCGTALSKEYALEQARDACHTARSVIEGTSKDMDVTGGWHLNEKADRDVVTGCSVLNNLLLAYTINPTAFTDETGIPESGNGVPDILDEMKYEADWLMKMQDTLTGGVYEAAVVEDETSAGLLQASVTVKPISDEATMAFAGTMAKFGNLYKAYDTAVSNQYLTAAKAAWEYVSTDTANLSTDQAFASAAELYRVTGEEIYEKVLTAFFSKDGFSDAFLTNDIIFHGGITYLQTSQPVNVSICDALMKLLIRRTEGIVSGATASLYKVKDVDERGVNGLLSDMLCLTVTNHVNYSREYTEVIENYAHYLMGRNPDGINLVDQHTEYTYADAGMGSGIQEQPVANSELIILLSAIQN